MNWLRRLFGHGKEPLLPGKCECGHARCAHERGRYRCHQMHPPDSDTPEWTGCACQVFIPRQDDGGNDPHPATPVDPEIAELNRMMGKR